MVDFNDSHKAEGLGAVLLGLGTAKVPESKNNIDRRFRFQSLQDVMSNPTPPKWVIKNIFEVDSLCGTYAPPETLKSFMLIDMGLCVASGISWHGHEVKTSGPVLYICGEGARGIRRRVKAWMIVHERQETDPIPFFISNRAAALLDAKSLEEIDVAIDMIIETYGKSIMIIVDTLNRNMGDGDENSTRDMTALVKALDHLRARTSASVHVVHHTGLADTSRARGSSVLRGALDFEYSLQRKGENVVQLSFAKMKDHEKPKPLVFETEVVPLGEYDDDFDEICSIVLRLTDMPAATNRPKLPTAPRIALEALTAQEKLIQGGPVHIDDWRAETYKRGISENPEAKQKAFSRARTRLLDDGLITCNDDYYSLKKDEFILQDNQTDPDKTGHVRDVSGGVARTDTDMTLRECPMSGPGVRSRGDSKEKEKNSFLHEKKNGGGGGDPHLDNPVLPGLTVSESTKKSYAETQQGIDDFLESLQPGYYESSEPSQVVVNGENWSED